MKAAADWGMQSLRPGRDKAATTGVHAKCLQRQSPAGSCRRLGPARSGGIPSSARGGRGQRAGRGLLQPPRSLRTSQQWRLGSVVPGFFQELSRSWGSLLLRLSLHTSSCALPGLALQTPPCSTRPPLHKETHDSGRGAQGCGRDLACSPYSVLPSTDRLLCSPLIPQRPFSAPADLHTERGFSECGDLSFPSAPHLGCWSLPVSSFLLLSFFHPTWLCGEFSCPFFEEVLFLIKIN